MTIKLTWRKTTSHYALIDWTGIHQKEELPYEYINGEGAKFWYVPSLKCIQLGGDNGKDCTNSTYPHRLYVGTVLASDGHAALIKYVTAATNRLVVANKEKEMAETVIDEL